MTTLTKDELTRRAKKEPDAVLRVWRLDSRRMVKQVAKRELKERGR